MPLFLYVVQQCHCSRTKRDRQKERVRERESLRTFAAICLFVYSSFSFSIFALSGSFVCLTYLTCARFHVKCVQSFCFRWIFHICVSTNTISNAVHIFAVKCVDNIQLEQSSIFGMMFPTVFIPFCFSLSVSLCLSLFSQTPTMSSTPLRIYQLQFHIFQHIISLPRLLQKNKLVAHSLDFHTLFSAMAHFH